MPSPAQALTLAGSVAQAFRPAKKKRQRNEKPRRPEPTERSLTLRLRVSVAQLLRVLDYLCVHVEQTDQNEYRTMICHMRMNPARLFVLPKLALLTLCVPSTARTLTCL